MLWIQFLFERAEVIVDLIIHSEKKHLMLDLMNLSIFQNEWIQAD
jgi:hypothetical protein